MGWTGCHGLLWLVVFQTIKCTTVVSKEDDEKPRRVAIIGGGIGGSFAAKYLADYDVSSCSLDSVVLFDPTLDDEIQETHANDSLQGGRVASVTLKDGTVVELGASVAYSGNRLLVEMIEGDPDSLTMGGPFHPGLGKQKMLDDRYNISEWRNGLGVYNGNGEWPLIAAGPDDHTKWQLFVRYNLDLLRIKRATNKALESFEQIYSLLDSMDPSTFFRSPDALWQEVGLWEYALQSFDQLLDSLWISKSTSLWRSFLPHQGSLRDELLTAVNLCNYNQVNSKLNGLAGMVSFIPTTGKLFSVVGGNNQLISSALRQADIVHDGACKNGDFVNHVKKAVTTVISDFEGMELWSGEENLGHFDTVILAAPLQHSGISFYIHSHVDAAILQDMPLNLVAPNEDVEEDASRPHFYTSPLPLSAKLQYTQVVTTVVSNATLQLEYFSLSDINTPRSLYVTERGKQLHGITAITEVTPDGVYKMFSSERLSENDLSAMFGSGNIVEAVKVWGGRKGGATPNYNGGGNASIASNFLLYESGQGIEEGPALYYINAIEAAVSCMEFSAIGAKSVAKLVAKRLKLIEYSSPGEHEEL
eukprot:scaffold29674_cov51-Attheya_sp.AAC.2